jgi:hypothetical protein
MNGHVRWEIVGNGWLSRRKWPQIDIPISLIDDVGDILVGESTRVAWEL